MTKKEFQAFVNKEYAAYESQIFFLVMIKFSIKIYNSNV